MTSGKPLALRVAALVCSSCLRAFAAWVVSLGPLPLEEARQISTTIVDRNGKLLRAYAMADGRWRLPVDAKKDVDPTYLNLLLAYRGPALLRACRRRSDGAGARGLAARLARPHRLRRLDHHHAAGAADGGAGAIIARSTPSCGRSCARSRSSGSSARTRSSTSIWRWRRSAAISKASAPPRSPISARSRSGCRWRRPRCWSRCRNRRRRAGSTAIPEAARAARDRVLDRMVEEHRVTPEDAAQAKATRCRSCASRCRSWRRIPPMPRWQR